MKYYFDPHESFIEVQVVVVGLLLFGRTIFALDTGATQTGIDEDLLARLGFDPTHAIRQFSVATVRGRVPMFEYRMPAFSALGIDVTDFDVCAVDLRASSFDGVLGKDFFKDRILTIDFRNGTIEVV